MADKNINPGQIRSLAFQVFPVLIFFLKERIIYVIIKKPDEEVFGKSGSYQIVLSLFIKLVFASNRSKGR